MAWAGALWVRCRLREDWLDEQFDSLEVKSRAQAEYTNQFLWPAFDEGR